jgi:thiol-disulfide isomerase/thioredoxin
MSRKIDIPNLKKVKLEGQLTEIFAQHLPKPVVVMFSMENCKYCKPAKAEFVKLAEANPDVFCVYILREEFDGINSRGSAISLIRTFPSFMIHSGVTEPVIVEGAKMDRIVNMLQGVRARLMQLQYQTPATPVSLVKEDEVKLAEIRESDDNVDNECEDGVCPIKKSKKKKTKKESKSKKDSKAYSDDESLEKEHEKKKKKSKHVKAKQDSEEDFDGLSQDSDELVRILTQSEKYGNANLEKSHHEVPAQAAGQPTGQIQGVSPEFMQRFKMLNDMKIKSAAMEMELRKNPNAPPQMWQMLGSQRAQINGFEGKIQADMAQVERFKRLQHMQMQRQQQAIMQQQQAQQLANNTNYMNQMMNNGYPVQSQQPIVRTL